MVNRSHRLRISDDAANQEAYSRGSEGGEVSYQVEGEELLRTRGEVDEPVNDEGVDQWEQDEVRQFNEIAA